MVNGKVVRTLSGAELSRPADPFGTAGLVRFEGTIPLAGLLPQGTDAWLVVEAGTALPLAADLGGGPDDAPDGIPDTSDNNKDGVVDSRDAADGSTSGPLSTPLAPTDDADPLFHFAHKVSDGYPFAFTNPFILDVDGNGRFDAPGVER